MNKYSLVWNHAKQVAPGLLSLIVILIILRIEVALGFFGFWPMIFTILIFMFVTKTYGIVKNKEELHGKAFLWSVVVMILTVFVIIKAIELFGRWGYWGVFGFYIGYAFYRMFGRARYRKNFFGAIEMIVSMLWGVEFKFKEYKEEGKKLPKLKFVWRKKNANKSTEQDQRDECQD